MKVLIVGSGGREHALAWKVAQSKRVAKVYCAPGNAGTAEVAENLDIKVDDLDGLARFARANRIDLTIVGPEAPLVAGIVERFERDRRPIFGPSSRAAELEGSKSFSKNLMRRHGIPTAEYQIFEDFDRARTYIEGRGGPMVVKADGLAAGKGVYVCSRTEEALDAARRVLLDNEFGAAGAKLVVEELLRGEEASIIALTDGATIAPLESAQDHKPAYDGDKGPNTGGMGAYSPAPVVTEPLMDRIVRDILVPTVHAMNKEGRPFKGVLYAGLMITDQGPKVLEYNVRFGDPEAQPLLMRLRSDIVDLIEAVIEGRLEDAGIEWDPRPAVCVVMAAGGYPGEYRKGQPIAGLDSAAMMPDVKVFHGGTAFSDDKVVTAGGRVLGVTALGPDIAGAIERGYRAADMIHWDGVHFRRDIGAKALARGR